MSCEEWPIVWTCDKPAGLSPEQEAAAVASARVLLWARTGRRLGVCTAIERFVPGGCVCPAPVPGTNVSWHHTGPNGDIFLFQSPAVRVVEVRELGLVLSPNLYRLEGQRLVRLGGQAWAPSVDALATVQVTYEWGVPIGGTDLAGLVSLAMGEIAGEVAQGVCGGVCKLPSRVTSIVRAGVTINLGVLGDLAKEGKLGLPLTDQLIDTVNPHHRPEASRVYSPDVARSV